MFSCLRKFMINHNIEAVLKWKFEAIFSFCAGWHSGKLTLSLAKIHFHIRTIEIKILLSS